MSETNDDGTTSYDNGDTTTTWGAGYDNPDTQTAYETDTSSADGLYEASTQAYVAGDTYDSEQLNDASIAAEGDANTEYQEYNGIGDYSGVETYDTPAVEDTTSYEAPVEDTTSYEAPVEDTTSYDSGDSGGSDFSEEFADYAGS